MKSPKNFGLDLSQVAVVLVGRLGQAGHVGLFGHRLAIRHHWVAHNEVTLGILVLPWANPRFQNHPRLVENLDWMIPIGPSWVKRNAIFWGAIFIYICIYGGFRSQKNTLLFCMKKRKKTDCSVEISFSASQTNIQPEKRRQGALCHVPNLHDRS